MKPLGIKNRMSDECGIRLERFRFLLQKIKTQIEQWRQAIIINRDLNAACEYSAIQNNAFCESFFDANAAFLKFKPPAARSG